MARINDRAIRSGWRIAISLTLIAFANVVDTGNKLVTEHACIELGDSRRHVLECPAIQLVRRRAGTRYAVIVAGREETIGTGRWHSARPLAVRLSCGERPIIPRHARIVVHREERVEGVLELGGQRINLSLSVSVSNP